MGHVKKIEYGSQSILEIDYSDCNEGQMIRLVSQAGEIVLSENRSLLILVILNSKSFLTPNFMRHGEKVTIETLHLIDKQAIVGMSTTQKIILQGYNILFQRNFKAFDSREEAIRYLLNVDATDDDLPEYFKKKPKL